MGINLEKGQKISLEKEAGQALTSVFVGLGWDVSKGMSIDLDASCVLLDDNKNVVDTISFKNKKGVNESVMHSGDNVTGKGDGDDEVIKVHLNKIPENVKNIVFTVNSYSGHTFDKVQNAFCRVVNDSNKQEIARYNLTEMKANTGLIIAKLYKHNGEWKMTGIGEFANGRVVGDIINSIKNSI